MAKTTQEIIESLKKRLAYANPKLDLTSGNVATDLGVESFAEELTALYNEQDRIRLLYLFDASAFNDAEADALANSFGIYRISATKATGEVIFGATTLPAEGSQYTIPVGTTVSTDGDSGSKLSFTTTTPGIITHTTPLNPATNYYEVIVSVEADVVGSSQNVGPGAINTITNAVSGVSLVYNADSITNGTDQETSASLIARTKQNLVGYVYGTKASFLNKAMSYPKVTDAVVVDPNSEFSVRGPGTVDIYIVGDVISSFTQEILNSEQQVTLIKNPVATKPDGSSLGTAIVAFSDGTTLEEGNGFNIVADTETAYANSAEARDKIVWTDAAYADVVQTHNYNYTVTYSYNKLVEDLQTDFESEENHILTSSVLVRKTKPLYVRMDFDIVTLAGYNGDSVRNNVVFAIENFVNSMTLNQTLRQSDVINIIENVAGVDYVKLPMRAFCLASQVDNTVEDIPSSPLEYLRINASDIVIG